MVTVWGACTTSSLSALFADPSLQVVSFVGLMVLVILAL